MIYNMGQNLVTWLQWSLECRLSGVNHHTHLYLRIQILSERKSSILHQILKKKRALKQLHLQYSPVASIFLSFSNQSFESRCSGAIGRPVLAGSAYPHDIWETDSTCLGYKVNGNQQQSSSWKITSIFFHSLVKKKTDKQIFHQDTTHFHQIGGNGLFAD